MQRKEQRFVKKWILGWLGIFLLSGCVPKPCPLVNLEIIGSPPVREVEVGSSPIALTARLSASSNVQMKWDLQGPGSFRGDTTQLAILYIPPENIHGTSEEVIIIAKVTDEKGCTMSESFILNIIAPPPPSDEIVDSFEYTNIQEFQRVWRTDITSKGGRTDVELDATIVAPNTGSSQSLKINTHIPCLQQGGRTQQIVRYWNNDPQNWSTSNILEMWIKGDGINELPERGVLSIGLRERSGEVWVSSRRIARTSDWTKIELDLTRWEVGGTTFDKNFFVMPEWARRHEINGQLNVEQITELWIQTMTFDSWACGNAPDANGQQFPDFTVWIDHVVRRR